MSAIDLEIARNELEQSGYTCQFIQKGIPNHSSKKMLLTNYHPTHDIGVFKSQGRGISIELTVHATKYDEKEGPYSLKDGRLLLKTPSLVEEREFWINALHFMPTAQTHRLEMKSMVPSWSTTIEFLQDSGLSPSNLDSRGHSCLAFLTNDLEQDKKILKNCGANNITPTFQVMVNMRKLQVSLFRTPGGALCELMRVQRNE